MYSKRSRRKHFCHIGRIKVSVSIQITRTIRAAASLAYPDFKVYCSHSRQLSKGARGLSLLDLQPGEGSRFKTVNTKKWVRLNG